MEKARFFSPTDPKIPYSLVIFYSMLGNIDKTFSEADKMLKLKSDFKEGIVLKNELQKKYAY